MPAASAQAQWEEITHTHTHTHWHAGRRSTTWPHGVARQVTTMLMRRVYHFTRLEYLILTFCSLVFRGNGEVHRPMQWEISNWWKGNATHTHTCLQVRRGIERCELEGNKGDFSHRTRCRTNSSAAVSHTCSPLSALLLCMPLFIWSLLDRVYAGKRWCVEQCGTVEWKPFPIFPFDRTFSSPAHSRATGLEQRLAERRLAAL